ncbi:MAG: flagellar basal body rod protein FlgB [Betaproteobacteria bacterium]|nr:flagellar basal body rod protein FlgB [Betaproteobacteria bacterium]
MLNQLGDTLTYHGDALKLRAERQRVLAANIANADTPNYKAMDFDFKSALQNATTGFGSPTSAAAGVFKTDARHLSTSTLSLPGVNMQYRTPNQLSIDGNSVEMDTERASFADNAVRYEASLRFLNGQIKTLSLAIQGQ